MCGLKASWVHGSEGQIDDNIRFEHRLAGAVNVTTSTAGAKANDKKHASAKTSGNSNKGKGFKMRLQASQAGSSDVLMMEDPSRGCIVLVGR